MASVCLMYWVAKQKRWMKEYRGKTYAVSCRQLKCPATKEESRQFANEWWQRKQEELDKALGESKRHPAHITNYYADAIENWRLFSKWHRKYGDISAAQKAETTIDFLREALKSENPPFPLTKLQEDPRWATIRDLQSENDKEAAYALWFDRFLTIKKEERAEQSVPLENTIRAHAADYLELKKAKAEGTARSAPIIRQSNGSASLPRGLTPTCPLPILANHNGRSSSSICRARSQRVNTPRQPPKTIWGQHGPLSATDGKKGSSSTFPEILVQRN